MKKTLLILRRVYSFSTSLEEIRQAYWIYQSTIRGLKHPSSGLLIFASIKIPVTWLKRGVNTIILKPKDTVKATSIAIDPSYSFGRSYILNQSHKWERLKKGEFMLHLELKKFPVAIKSNVKF